MAKMRVGQRFVADAWACHKGSQTYASFVTFGWHDAYERRTNSRLDRLLFNFDMVLVAFGVFGQT